MFNPIFCWREGLCFLPVIWPEAKLWWRQWRYCWPPSKRPMHALLHSVLQLCSRPPPTHTSSRDSWTLTDKSESVSCRVTTPFICIHEDHYVNGMFSPPTKLKTTTWEEVNWCIAPHNPHCPSIKGPGGGNFYHLTYYVYFTLLTVLTL